MVGWRLGGAAVGNAEIITSAALVIRFLLITAPLSGHALAQAAHGRGQEDEPL
ncbi:MAG: monovalent cation/H(+) antiporter subunit G [Thermoleophilaceae bacterium]